jgi:peptide chain release factor 3
MIVVASCNNAPMQLEVLAARIKSEYELGVRFEAAPYDAARWIDGAKAEVERFVAANRAAVAEDHDGAPVFLARNAWELNTILKEWPAVKFTATREQA